MISRTRAYTSSIGPHAGGQRGRGWRFGRLFGVVRVSPASTRTAHPSLLVAEAYFRPDEGADDDDDDDDVRSGRWADDHADEGEEGEHGGDVATRTLACLRRKRGRARSGVGAPAFEI